MAWPGRKKINSTAATTFTTPPPRQTINEARTPWEAIILLSFACGVLLLVLAWYIAVFLLDTAGYPQPDKMLAEGLINLAILALIVYLAGLVGKWFVGEWLDYKRDKLEVKVKIAEIKYSFDHRLPATVAAATTNEKQRLYHATIDVMERGYKQIDENGKLMGRIQPWSRRSVGRLQLINEADPIGEGTKLAGNVARYLLEQKILLNDTTINIEQFPNLNAVKICLDNDLGQPIYLSGNGSGMSGNYIKKGGEESWG